MNPHHTAQHQSSSLINDDDDDDIYDDEDEDGGDGGDWCPLNPSILSSSTSNSIQQVNSWWSPNKEP